MHIFSLFDGISCGQIALKRAGVSVDSYYASEINRSAIRITQHNFPNTIQLGDVTQIQYQRIAEDSAILKTAHGEYTVEPFELLIGGSPCTDMSYIGTKRGMISEQGEILSLEQYLDLKKQGIIFQGQSYLFWEYVRLLHEVQPKYFLLENVRMAEKWKQVITDTVGVSPLFINSALVSAQNRPRFYWTNIPDVTIPKDRNILLDDILDIHADTTDVYYCKTVQKALPILEQHYGKIPERFNAYNTSRITDKARALTAGGSMVTSTCATLMLVPVSDGLHTVSNHILDNQFHTDLKDGRYNIRKLSVREMERLQTLPDDYTNAPNTSEQQRRHGIGNGWTVDVIAHIFSHIPKGEAI